MKEAKDIVDSLRREMWITASQLPRIAVCPGSWRLCKKVENWPKPEEPEETKRGKRIHALLEGKEVKASLEEQAEAENAWRSVSVLTTRLWGKPVADLDYRREVMLAFDAGNVGVTGRFDLLVFNGDEVLLVDFKSGKPVEEEKENAQILAGVAGLIRLYPQIKQIYASIIYTWKKYPAEGPDYVFFGPEEIQEAVRFIAHILKQASAKDAPLVPSKHCAYCPANVYCEATQKAIAKFGGEVKPDVKEYVRALPPDRLSELLLAWEEWVKKVGNALVEEAKRRLREDPESVPGWKLTKPTTVRKISVPILLYKRLRDLGIPTQEIFAHVSYPLWAVRHLIEKKFGPGEEAKKKLEEVLSGIIEEQPRAQVLRRVKQ